MFFLKNKKSDSQFWWVIVGAILVIVVVFLVIIWFKGSGGKVWDIIGKEFGSLEDYDDDKVANRFDKCPCTALGTVEEEKLEGCPQGTTLERAQLDQKSFKEEKCPELEPPSLVEEERETRAELFLYTEKEGTIAPDYQQLVADNELFYSFSCFPPCTLKITFPDQATTAVTVEEGGSEMPLVMGSYTFILEQNSEIKEVYQIEKE